jgi:hypothetical protein
LRYRRKPPHGGRGDGITHKMYRKVGTGTRDKRGRSPGAGTSAARYRSGIIRENQDTV